MWINQMLRRMGMSQPRRRCRHCEAALGIECQWVCWAGLRSVLIKAYECPECGHTEATIVGGGHRR
jgi:hypothetical protein